MKKTIFLAASLFLYAVCFGGNSPLPSLAKTNRIQLEKLSKENFHSPTCFPGKDKDKTKLFPYEESESFVLVR